MGTGLFLGFTNDKEITMKSLPATMFLYCLGLTLTMGLASLRVFGAEKVVFWREAAPGSGMGLNPLPYFIAKNLVEIPRLAILVSVEAVSFYCLVQPECRILDFIGKSIMASWHIAGYAQFLSIALNDKSAQLSLVILCLVFLLYSGARNTLGNMGGFQYAMSWLSPDRWLMEDVFVCHTHSMTPIYRLLPSWYENPQSLSIIAYEYKLFFTEGFIFFKLPAWNVIMNFWFGFLWRIVAFFCLTYLNRDKMGRRSYANILAENTTKPILRCFESHFSVDRYSFNSPDRPDRRATAMPGRGRTQSSDTLMDDPDEGLSADFEVNPGDDGEDPGLQTMSSDQGVVGNPLVSGAVEEKESV